jgi:hypothetical protein
MTFVPLSDANKKSACWIIAPPLARNSADCTARMDAGGFLGRFAGAVAPRANAASQQLEQVDHAL